MSKKLETIQDIIDYLNKPENQFTSDLHVVKWDGRWPKISTYRLTELNDPKNRGLAAAILEQHRLDIHIES